MALTETRRKALKAYCRLDPELDPQEEQLLELCYLSAVGYLEGAGIAPPPPGSPREAQYDQAVNALVLDAWDLRGTELMGRGVQDNPSFRRLLNQLKLTERLGTAELTPAT